MLGFFFSCTSVQQSVNKNAEGIESETLLEEAESQIESNPESPFGYHFGVIAHQQIARTFQPEERMSHYTQMRIFADSAIVKYSSTTENVNNFRDLTDLIDATWNNEHNSAAGLFSRDSTLSRQRLATARAHALNATIIQPANRLSFELLSDIYLKDGNINAAIATLESYTQFPAEESGVLYEKIGFLYGKSGGFGQASYWYSKAIDWHNLVLESSFTGVEDTYGSKLNTYHGAINTLIDAQNPSLALVYLRELNDAFPDNILYREAIITQLVSKLRNEYSENDFITLYLAEDVISELQAITDETPSLRMDAGNHLFGFTQFYTDTRIDTQSEYKVLEDDVAVYLLKTIDDLFRSLLESGDDSDVILNTLIEVHTLLENNEVAEKLRQIQSMSGSASY